MISTYIFDLNFGECPLFSFEMKSYTNLSSAFWQKKIYTLEFYFSKHHDHYFCLLQHIKWLRFWEKKCSAFSKIILDSIYPITGRSVPLLATNTIYHSKCLQLCRIFFNDIFISYHLIDRFDESHWWPY